MISREEIKRISAKTKVKGGAMITEKDYAITWLLSGIYAQTSRLREALLFKGGTALSKLFFPGTWRLSEDLDFTVHNQKEKLTIEKVKESLESILKETSTLSGISFSIAEFFSNPGFVRAKVKYAGPLEQTNVIKVEINLIEKTMYTPEWHMVKSQYSDLLEFKVHSYSIKEVFIEKLRAAMQRGYSRDYYDIWRMLTEKKVDKKFEGMEEIAKDLQKKCEINGNEYRPELILNQGQLSSVLWKEGLERLVTGELPPFEKVIGELKEKLKGLM